MLTQSPPLLRALALLRALGCLVAGAIVICESPRLANGQVDREGQSGFEFASADEDVMRVRVLEEFGLKLCVREAMEPAEVLEAAEFFRSIPCISASNIWVEAETEDCWICNLCYPTDNTLDYETNEGLMQLVYLTRGIYIKKDDRLPFDLRNHHGAIVIRKPSADTRMDQPGADAIFEVIGFADDDSDVTQSFLFRRHSEFRFRPDE